MALHPGGGIVTLRESQYAGVLQGNLDTYDPQRP